MSTRPALNPAPEDSEALRLRIIELEDYLRTERRRADRAEEELQALRSTVAHEKRAIAGLQHQLQPLYHSLRKLFGEMDAINPDVESAPAQASGYPSDPRVNAVWESWKGKLRGTAAKIIEALLLHGQMNTQQLAIATGLHRTTIPKGIYDLNKAGLINKNGGIFSLKQL